MFMLGWDFENDTCSIQINIWGLMSIVGIINSGATSFSSSWMVWWIVFIVVADIDFISVTIFSFPVPASCIGAVDVIDVSLLHLLAQIATDALFQVAVPPEHVRASDEREQNRDGGQAQEDVDSDSKIEYQYDINV